VEVRIEDGVLEIRIPVLEKPEPGKSGRTLTVASSADDRPTRLLVDGNPLYVRLRAYIKRRDLRSNARLASLSGENQGGDTGKADHGTFWSKLRRRAAPRTKLLENLKPEKWYYSGIEVRQGVRLNCVLYGSWSRVEVYINTGSLERNAAIFGHLMSSKDRIESTFGETLEWEQVPGKPRFRIVKRLDLGGLFDKEKWPEIQDAMIQGMIRLERAFRPHIEALPL